MPAKVNEKSVAFPWLNEYIFIWFPFQLSDC